jgi:hypothetical protein
VDKETSTNLLLPNCFVSQIIFLVPKNIVAREKGYTHEAEFPIVSSTLEEPVWVSKGPKEMTSKVSIVCALRHGAPFV